MQRWNHQKKRKNYDSVRCSVKISKGKMKNNNDSAALAPQYSTKRQKKVNKSKHKHEIAKKKDSKTLKR